MTERASGAEEATRLDFNALYRGDFDSRNRSESVQSTGLDLDLIPWDIGEPQPVLRELERLGQIRSEVLDTGRGLGGNDLFLAERGYRVLSVDIAPAAIERARARAQSRGLDVEFAVADATTLKGYKGRFVTVINCGRYHCLTDQQRETYLTAVHHACQPVARLHVMGTSAAAPDLPAQYEISQTNLHAFTTPSPTAGPSATLSAPLLPQHSPATTSRHGPRYEPAFGWSTELGYDQHGRLLLPAWMATVERL